MTEEAILKTEFILNTNEKLLSIVYNRLNRIFNAVRAISKNIHLYENKVLCKFNMRVGEILKMVKELGFIVEV